MEGRSQGLNVYSYVPDELKSKFIGYNDAWFDIKVLERFSLKPEVLKLTNEIDMSTVVDKERWTMKDRLGTTISMSELSTGCKTCINVLYFPDYLVTGLEMGGNAVKSLLTNLDSGNILFNSPVYFLDDFQFKEPIIFHDEDKVVSLNYYYELCDLLSEKFDTE